MPQLSLYIDDATMTQMKERTAAEKRSLSRFAAEAIREKLQAPMASTREGYWEKLYGCLADDDSFVRPAQLETRPIPALDVQ